MTDAPDDDLAPVTELFGAGSRRRTAARAIPVGGGATDADASGSGASGNGATNAGASGSGASGGGATNADASGSGASGGGATSRGAVVRGGTVHGTTTDDDATVSEHAQARWVSPVVGDGSGRSARAEQAGYDEPADAHTASVFAIGDGRVLDPGDFDPGDAAESVDAQLADAERISMKALGRKGISESEMRTTLRRQQFDDDVVEHEIERLTRVGLLDDLALATDLVDRLHERKGLGHQGIVAELRRRGIDQSAIDQAFDAASDDDDDEFVRAEALAQKRAAQMRGLDRATAERRLSGFLMRKGYGSGVVRIAVERALDRPSGPPTTRSTVRFE